MQQIYRQMTQYRSRWPKELDLNQGDLIQVLFKEDETWWFGRLTNGSEGYFPAACVEPLQVTALIWSTELPTCNQSPLSDTGRNVAY
uniref:SH3 domain-containing protein n=1 Tax=Dicentrarchus labrax TaxID=13489 RepID=A0A8C4EPT3_DICLA